jgi:beta-phosphoglucomutase-like phosphatase (HAD superfamily)
MLRAIVFDFDGVIANSEPLHYGAFRDVLAEAGVSLSETDYYDKYLGYDDLGVFRTLGIDRGLDWPDARLAAFVAAKALLMEVAEKEGALLFPGAREAIARAAEAVPLAIASGALGPEIRHVLQREGLLACFTTIVSAEDTPASKPAPDPYLRAVRLLGETAGRPLKAHECVAIEDSPWGLQSARTAGLRTVAVAQTYEMSALEADLVIKTVADLDLDAIGRLCTR